MEDKPGLWQPPMKPSTIPPDWSHLHTTKQNQVTIKSVSSTSTTSALRSSLLGLPLELRRMVWRRVLPYRPTSKVTLFDMHIVPKPLGAWEEGSVALFRVNKQIYNEAMPILYGEEYFTVMIQPRRALLVFTPYNRQQRPRFGLVQPKQVINVDKHPGLALVRYWELLLSYHSLHGKRRQTLRCDGLQTFFKFTEDKSKDAEVHVALWGQPNTKFVYLQLLNAVLVGMAMRPGSSVTWKLSKAEIADTIGNLRSAFGAQNGPSNKDFMKNLLEKGKMLLAQPVRQDKSIQFATSYAGKKKNKPRGYTII